LKTLLSFEYSIFKWWSYWNSSWLWVEFIIVIFLFLRTVNIRSLVSESKFDVDSVLLQFDDEGKNVTIGAPVIEGAKVTFKVLEHKLGDKVRVYKMKAKKRYRRNKGHRQSLSVLEVVDVK